VQAIKAIKSRAEGAARPAQRQGKLLEAQRLEQRTTFDLEMMEATGSCAGIENYSRYLTGRGPASRRRRCSNICPTTRWCSSTRAMSPCRRSAACIAATSPQGDAGRIRLPPALLHGQPAAAFEEWDAMRPQTVYVSATPARGRWSAPAACSSSR
jgi:excinuclease ABC subunit B